MAVHLQRIIGVDKKNPYFTICKDTSDPSKVHVFFGAALMEVVPLDKSNPEFKLLIARLYNAGIRAVAIKKAFGIARSTMKRWAAALKSGDPERLVRALSGAGAPRKLTEEIRAFIRVRFPKIYKETKYTYSAVIREEIKEIFGEDISSETLRPLFNELKKEEKIGERKQGNESKEHPCNRAHPGLGDDVSCTTQSYEGQEQCTTSDYTKADGEPSTPEADKESIDNRRNSISFHSQESSASLPPLSNKLKMIEGLSVRESESKNISNRCDLSDPVLAERGAADTQIFDHQRERGSEPAKYNEHVPYEEAGEQRSNRTSSLIFYSHEIAFCYHIGVLLFSNEIYEFREHVKNELATQFLVAILLGAKNIEQTKILDFNALKAMLGIVTPNRFMQRKQLSEMATDENIKELQRFNALIVNAHHYTDFYYDPHVKRYSGAEKILKGWCAILQKVSKIVNMDFFHTAVDGHPVYLEVGDNFNTMAERFMKQIKDFRDILHGENKVLTFIFDRGIFAFEVFEALINDKLTHIITWEKGYKKDKWDEGKIGGTFSLLKRRNNMDDLIKYDFEYMDQEWEKKSEMRQLIVRATNPKGRCIEVSILTDDTGRKAEEIIELMFTRWVQENDFKYEEKHFGINEITTYSVMSYKKLENLIEDKQAKRGEYKALERVVRNIKGKLKNALFKKHSIKNNKKREEQEEKIKDLSTNLEQIKIQMSTIDKEGSKIEELIDNEYKRLNTQTKKYMDCIKIIARNIFYKVLQPFKEKYNNYRDDHVLFRNLSHAHGVVSFADEQVHVTIFPTAHYQPKVRKIIEEIFQQINNKRPLLPDGSKRVVHLELGKKLDDVLFIIKESESTTEH
jgi:transposase